MIITSGRRITPAQVSLITGILVTIGGTLAAIHYHRLGLTLTHYDSRGHLVVARRIMDSITPGWQQIGAVWLPLPHLLNALPVQIDVMYRTGASAVGISILSFAVAAASVAWIVVRMTGCSSAALAAAAVFAFNPNVVYLQSTPMTEPLLLALTTVAVALLIEFVAAADTGRTRGSVCIAADNNGSASGPTVAQTGWAFALACLTRYEAWPVTAAALALAVTALWRRGKSFDAACRAIGPIALYPAIAIAAFFVFSRVVIGVWFVSSGFFIPENKSLGKPLLAAAEIWWGSHSLSGSLVIAVATVGLVWLLIRSIVGRTQAPSMIALSLVATAVLPWAAFIKGHPFRIRYMVPLIAIEAIGAGTATSLAGKWRSLAAAVLVIVAAYELHPLDERAPMVVEAQWDRPNMAMRDRVSEYLRASYDGTKIMASMGSLGHYMQEASAEGFSIRDFLHEGNGDIWLAALQGPRRFVGWVLIEEKAQGGDMLARRARADPHFLDGFAKVAEGAGMELYRRTAASRRLSAVGDRRSIGDRRPSAAAPNTIADRR